MPKSSHDSPFKRAPNFGILGLEGKKHTERTQDLPAHIPAPEQVIEISQIHRKASLIQGQIMVKDHLKIGRSKVFVFIDNSLSCQSFFKKNHELKLLQNHLASWLSFHQWSMEIITSEAKPGEHKWGPQLWEQWHKALVSHHDAIALIFSDFHGEDLEGMFWKHLQSLAYSRIICWQHRLSDKGDHDIEDSQIIHRKKNSEFLDIQSSWRQRLEQTLSQMGFNSLKVKPGTLEQIETEVANYLS